MVLLRWIHQNCSELKAYAFVPKRMIANSLIKALKLFLHSSVHCTQIRPAQWKRWWASHSQHLSLFLCSRTISHSLSLVTLPASVSPFSSPMIQALSQSLKSCENAASVTLQNPHLTSRGKVSFVCGSVNRLGYGPNRDHHIFWMPPLSIRRLLSYHLHLLSYLSLISCVSFFPRP